MTKDDKPFFMVLAGALAFFGLAIAAINLREDTEEEILVEPRRWSPKELREFVDSRIKPEARLFPDGGYVLTPEPPPHPLKFTTKKKTKKK